MPQTAVPKRVPRQVVVVGAGIVGASIAWHLTAAGCAVTIVDAGNGGGLATPASFAWINASWGNPEWYFRFRRRGMAGWRRLARDVPGLRVDWCGGLLWDLQPAELLAYAEQHGSWGYAIARVGRDAALAFEPGLRHPPELALHVAEEGALEPAETADALLFAAVANGARFLRNVRVARLTQSNGRVTGIGTEAGESIAADETVVAAGIETARLLETIGVGLELDAPPGLIAHTTISDRKVLNGLVMTPDFHVRQTRQGRLIIGSDFAGGDPKGHDTEMANALLESVKMLIRGTESLALDFVSVGLRPTPRDGFPVIGRPAGIEGLYAAVLHSGVTLASVVGELAAREIETGARDPDLAPYDPNRAAVAG